MSGFDVPISTAIKRFRSKIDFMQPLLEAISNSLEANARNIKIKLFVDRGETLTGEPANKICGYTIEDDGDGFNEKNIKSFLTYMTDYKYDLGCKGIGRITWLKVFTNVTVKSHIKDKIIEFKFNEAFDKDKIKCQAALLSDKPNTKILFFGVRSSYYVRDKVELRTDANLEDIRSLIEGHFLVKLSLLKANDRQFNIEIFFDKSQNIERICNASLIDLREKDFSIKGADNSLNNFKLFYKFFNNTTKQKRATFFCANGRIVKQIPEKISYTSLPENKSSILLLTSKYFDEHVNEERNEFNIPDTRPSLESGLSWELINGCLRYKIDEVLLEYFPTLEEDNDKKISELIDEYPYLARYIRTDTSKIKDKEKILKNSKRLYEQDKENTSIKFKSLLEENNINTDVFYKIIENVQDISARELAEYIVYRKQIIAALQKINNGNEKKESLLHNLFMKMRTESDNENRAVYDNNLWLLDDKYMTYVYAASDFTIEKIKQSIEKESEEIFNTKIRPDLAVFYSSGDDDKYRDAVVVEFKGIGANLDEKSKSFWEINRNAEAIRENIRNIRRVWAYTITKFDDKFRKNIRTQDFEPLFGNGCKDEIYYRYFSKIDAHCYYISVEAILADADARNNVFLDIIKDA
ncbi:MAG: ATP-binding protein [Solidesulfovibrio sp.]|uniref:ATP-binding protein n=1 Tax=Solidesulfovibrio sp. TaxID=2910990 RepID=UPI00315949C7